MINLSFADIIQILLNHKAKTHKQNRLIRDLFSLCLEKEAKPGYEDEDNTAFSKWCNGKRAVPEHIVEFYEEEEGFIQLKSDIEHKILPHIVNLSKARKEAEQLVKESETILGSDKSYEFLNIKDDAEFFASLIHYALVDGQKTTSVLLSKKLMTNHVPSISPHFHGRKKELSECHKILRKESPVFVCGVAGIGKSEFAKCYAFHNRNKYASIIYIFYNGSLKQSIIDMEFSDDKSEMTPEELFTRHYSQLRKCGDDCLVILDNYNVLPKDDPFFKEFSANDFKLLVTTRCHLNQNNILTLVELDIHNELIPLFYDLCPAAKNDSEEATLQIIQLLHSHTLCTVLAALSMNAAGISAETLRDDLLQCGIDLRDNEQIELNKDDEYTEALMQEHLRLLLHLSEKSDEERYLLQNLSLFPASGVDKQLFKAILSLDSLSLCNHLGKYGYLFDDEENRCYYLHPIIRDIIILDTKPSVCSCRTLFDHLHAVCLLHGLEPKRPTNWVQTLLSVSEKIIIDEPATYLMFLEDMFAFVEKFCEISCLVKICDRISYVIKGYGLIDPSDAALLLDYRAEIHYRKSNYESALKNRLNAIEIMEKIPDEEMDDRRIRLLSNLYNNLANVYASRLNPRKGKEAMQKALLIRSRLSHNSSRFSHDDLQQRMNLCHQYAITGEINEANAILQECEPVILTNEGPDSADYGTCLFSRGIIAIKERNYSAAHKYLEDAKSIIAGALGDDAAEYKSISNMLLGLKLLKS